MLWVKNQFLSIVSEIPNTIIKAVYMLLDWLDNSPTTSLLSGHLHSQIHEEHVFSMATLKLFLLLFLVVD